MYPPSFSDVGLVLIIISCYVYILQLKDKTYYRGYSDDLKQRINDHQSGAVLSRKNLKSFKPIFYAAFESKTKALQFEKYLKTTSVLLLETDG